MPKLRDKYLIFLINKRFVQGAKIIYSIELGIGIIFLLLWQTSVPLALFFINFIALVGIEIKINKKNTTDEKVIFDKKVIPESHIIKFKKLQIVVWFLIFFNAVPFQGILKFLKESWVNITSLMIVAQDAILILIYLVAVIWYSNKID